MREVECEALGPSWGMCDDLMKGLLTDDHQLLSVQWEGVQAPYKLPLSRAFVHEHLIPKSNGCRDLLSGNLKLLKLFFELVR